MKFYLHWVASICVLLIANSGLAQPVEISGQVVFADGTPISDAQIVIRDLHGGTGGMPKVKFLGVVRSNVTGSFYFRIKRMKGALDIRVLSNRCNWSGDVLSVPRKQYLKGKVSVLLSPLRVDCEGRRMTTANDDSE